MPANFKTCRNNSKITYSPEIEGKIIVETESKILTAPEYHVCYGKVDRITGLVSFKGCTIQPYDTLEEAKRGLVAFSGYGKPKEPFNPTRRRPLKPLHTRHSNTSFGTMANLGERNLSSLEDSLRHKWKI